MHNSLHAEFSRNHTICVFHSNANREYNLYTITIYIYNLNVQCNPCQTTIAGYDAYKRHTCQKMAAAEESAQCHVCGRIITTRRNLDSHLELCAKKLENVTCKNCNMHSLTKHYQTCKAAPDRQCSEQGKNIMHVYISIHSM